MKKLLSLFFIFTVALAAVFAQSDDDLFGGDDDFFSDGDGIDVVEDISAKSDLSRGVLFETGAIKIGGSVDASLSTLTTLYADDDDDLGERIKNTALTPTLSALLSVDARPTQTLRFYTKFGLAYPFVVKASSSANPAAGITVTDWFVLKELFSDFSIADTAFFRFGIHTVTWGTGYFFSPVSDMINTSSINPEDADAQVDGSLNLRTQITFPGTQNCLWFYVIPSTDFTNEYTLETYARDTALAAKADLLFGGWEFALGGHWKYQNAPKVMLTASGSLKKISLFGEFVYRYGADSEWESNTDWDDKTNIVQATAGFSYYWKTPQISLAAQYYYDGNDKDLTHEYFTYGHNIAASLSFGRIFGTEDFSATVFAMANIGKDEIPSALRSYLEAYGIASYLNAFTASAMLNYSPVSPLKIGLGPYVTMNAWDEMPVISLKLSLTLGSGKF